MCGRFGSSFSGGELTERFELSEKPPQFDKSYNVPPGSHIPVITRNSPNKAVLMKWGFVPEWADPTKFKLHPINARDDQVTVSGFYKQAFAHKRCLIPFSWFYEWKKFMMDGKEEKQPYLIKVKNEPVMAFAGIYSDKKDAEGLPLYTCAIITTTPNDLMNNIHNRMPVILEKKDEDAWMDEKTDIEKVKKFLKPFESERMEAYRVSTLINNPRNDDDPELIKPIE